MRRTPTTWKRALLRLAVFVVAVLPAVLAWVAAAAVEPGFLVQAGAALVVYAGVAFGLLAALEREARTPLRTLARWTAAASLLYAVAAHLAVGRPPERALQDLAPLPGVEAWVLDDGGRLVFLRVPATGSHQGAGGVVELPAHPPIVWLHDGPGLPVLPMLRDPARRPLAGAAREGFDVVFYDQRGAGFSSRLDLRREAPYTVAGHVSDLEQIRVRMGADRMVLAGHGWGASLAVAYALEHRDRVEAMMLLSPNPLWYPAWEEFVSPSARARLSDIQASTMALLQRPTPRLLIGRLTASTSRAAAHGLVQDWEADQWWTRMTQESWRLGQPKHTCSEPPTVRVPQPEGLGFFAHSYTLSDALRAPDRRRELGALAVPVLILRGLCDWVTPGVAGEYLEHLPGAIYVPVPGAGHLLWLDMVSLQEQVVADFLAGRPVPMALFTPRR